MAGLKALGKQIEESCNEVIDKAQRMKNLRDPDRARKLGGEIARAAGDATHAIDVISREDGAWEELDRMKPA